MSVSTQACKRQRLPAHPQAPRFDVERVRRDFPALAARVHGHPLVYLDNAATTQKPQAVLDAIQRAYVDCSGNVHRGVHELSARATGGYAAARKRVRRFLNAEADEEVIFVRGATEAINLVAHSFSALHLGAGDEVIISAMEHHANIVPWQQACARHGAHLRVIPMNRAGELDMAAYGRLLGPRTKMVAVVHISNALGTVNPVAEMVAMAHRHGSAVLVDGAQAVPHMPVDVRALACDFYVLSSHKMFGPTGLGVLYGRRALLEAMPPYQTGGDMIDVVTFAETRFAGLPNKFEAGTPHIAGALGLHAALDYLEAVGRAQVARYEAELLAYAEAALAEVPGLTQVGTAARRASVISFTLRGIHPHDLGTVLDRQGIAIRSGHHCAQPVMQFYNLPATARASLALYNTRAEVDALVNALGQARKMFGVP